VRGKYRDVILPMTVLRRLDAVLEDSKQAVLDMKATLDRPVWSSRIGPAPGRRPGLLQHLPVHAARSQARASQQQLKADFEAYLDGFSPERAGDPRQLRVPQPDPAPVQGRCPGHR
jgi:type I restriction enzyme M protein